MADFDDLQGAVSVFGANNRVIYDDTGMPSIMVGLPKMKYKDIITNGADETIPFWIVDGKEINTIWVSKFLNIVENDRAYSLGARLPKNYITFDQALAACYKKGNGWHLNQTGIFGCINLLSQKLGTVPHGNTNYGEDYFNPFEKGVQPKGETQRTLTGSGGPTWYHNHDKSGIADICGNLREWTGGMRLVDGEIQIIPYGNSMKIDCDMSAASTLWKAIMPDGTLVDPGTTGTLKYNGLKVGTTAVTITTPQSGKLKALVADDVNIPKLLIAMGLFPEESATYKSDYFYIDSTRERLPLRGSAFGNSLYSGPSAVDFRYYRHDSYEFIGFRSAYYD